MHWQCLRRARQLDRLGHVIPEILDLMAGRGIPAEPELRAIASAPTEVQRAAWKGSANAFHSLPAIARACLRRRVALLMRSPFGQLLVRWMILALGVVIAAHIVPGIHYSD